MRVRSIVPWRFNPVVAMFKSAREQAHHLMADVGAAVFSFELLIAVGAVSTFCSSISLRQSWLLLQQDDEEEEMDVASSRYGGTYVPETAARRNNVHRRRIEATNVSEHGASEADSQSSTRILRAHYTTYLLYESWRAPHT